MPKETEEAMRQLFRLIARYDIELTLLGALLILLLAHNLDLAEAFIRWAEELEHLQVDEVIVVALYLALLSPALVWRRWRREVRRQTAIDNALGKIALQPYLDLCPHCHNVEDDRGLWRPIGEFLQMEYDIAINRISCPGCVQKRYPAQTDGRGEAAPK